MTGARRTDRRNAIAGGPRTVFTLSTESLRCSCCQARFYFVEHAGRVWRTECPNAACGEVLVVSRDRAFRRRVEAPGAFLRRVCPESPGFVQYVTEHLWEVGVAVGLVASAIAMVAASDYGLDALLVIGVALPASLVCAVLFSWGATRWFDRRFRYDLRRRDGARELGRTPFVGVSATPGWHPHDGPDVRSP